MTGGATNPQGSKFPHASVTPKKVLCLYAQEDARFFRELQSHLYIRVRTQKIKWLEISTGDVRGEAMNLIDQTGTRLPDLQGQFVDAIQQGRDIQRWAGVAPANTYLWQHLIWHLCQAERWDELQTTLTDLGFLARKVLYQGVFSLETDLSLVTTESINHVTASQSTLFSFLHGNIVRLSHLLRQVKTPAEIGSLLLTHIGNDPFVAAKKDLLAHELPRPFLMAWHPLPKRASSSLIRTLRGHTSVVSSCTFGPDGHLIVSASWDGTLKVWDALSGGELRALLGHTGMVNGCAFSPDGRFILSASSDCTLKVWDASSGRLLGTLSPRDAQRAVFSAGVCAQMGDKAVPRLPGLPDHSALSDRPWRSARKRVARSGQKDH